ncbi:MAG: uracil-DNA glycosylase [Candidatus Omnitrophota bacterium]
MPKNEALLFLKTLKEDGIEHVYVEKRPAGPQNDPSTPANEEIQELRDKVLKCKLCSELARTRHKVVFGAGNLRAKLVFVGEAPGADEDQQGLPFVGRAGQLLTKIIEAMEMTRDQVFICNVLKCRPPHNRPPAPGEVVNCRPYLKRQLEIIKPKVIVALGNHAVKALLQTDRGISQLRGSFQEYEGIPVMCTYHPAYLLRSPGEKRKVWEDMKKVMQFLAKPEE